MSSERPCWEIYNKEMSQLNHGHALWEPAPLPYSARIRPGDVGYIRTGCFQLLFSAGCPLGERKLGVDVPSTFEQLEVGPIINRQPRPPGYLSTNNVRATRVHFAAPVPPLSPSQPLTPQPSASPVPHSVTSVSSSTSDVCSKTLESISFRLTGGQGAALVTRCLTYREDIQRVCTFERYAKEHYASWVTFARETGHGSDINPVLVTGVDRTRDFAMMSYSDDDHDMMSEFIAPVSGVSSASAWGTWYTTGLVHTNCGPQLRCPPSPTTDLTPSGNSNMETGSDWYNQCVFVRYYTVRKRLRVPKVTQAGAGLHDPGSGGRKDEEESPDVEARSDSGSDIVSSSSDYGGENDKSSVTNIEPEILVHNTSPDEKDDFDVIADYVFQNSDADSVLIHHRDIALLREGNTGLSTQILERRPPITVDGNGVGAIGGDVEPSGDTRSNDPLVPSESEREETNKTELQESQPPSRLVNPSLGVRSCEREANIGAGGSVFKPIPPAHDDLTVGRPVPACESETVVPPLSRVVRSRTEKNEVRQSVASSILSDATASSSVSGTRRSLFSNPRLSLPALHPYSQPTPDEPHTPETVFKRFRSSLKQSIRAATRAGSNKHSTSLVSADAGGLSTTSTTTSKEKNNVIITEDPAKIKTKMLPEALKPIIRDDTSPSFATEKRRACKRRGQFPAREPGSTSYSTPSLRPVSLSSPALRLRSQAFSDGVRTPEVGSPTSNALVPPRRTRSISFKPHPTSISGLRALPPRRSSKETRVFRNASKSKLASTQTHTPSRRLRTTHGSAGMSHLPLSTSSPTIYYPPTRTGSPISRYDPVTPSTGDKAGRPSLDLPNPRRASVEGRRSAPSEPRPITPPFQIRLQGVTSNSPSITTSPSPPARGDYAYNRNSYPSTAPLFPSIPANLYDSWNPNFNANPEHRNLLRQATSILCKELLNPPENSTTGFGAIELEELELRLRALARLERIWGKSGGAKANVVPNTSGSGIAGFSGLRIGGVSTLGEDRERRSFSRALKDGYVLCQLMNKVRPGSIAHVDKGEDGVVRSSNITQFLASCFTMLELSPRDLFLRDDLVEGSFESLARVSKTIIALVGISENPSSGSPQAHPKLGYPQIPYSSMTTSSPLIDLSLSSTPPRDLHVHRSRPLTIEMRQSAPSLLSEGPTLGRDVSPDNRKTPPTSKAIIPRRTSLDRDPSFFRRSSLDNEVPSPRTVSNSGDQPKQNNVTFDPAAVAEEPELVRGRSHKEIDGSSSRGKPRPVSHDGSGRKLRRSRFESMVNLGTATNTASAGELLNRNASEENVVRLTLIVREEGKPLMQFRLGNCIGRGQFGAVYRALNLNTGQMVAVKRITLTGLKEKEISRLVKEVDIVKSLSHPSIVKYEGMVKDEDTLSIVLEYVENGSLGQILKAFGKLNERLVAGYVSKILEGLHYLHQSDVVHCDLKAANILTTKDGDVKLSDFGVSLNLHAMERETKEITGSPNWMAPEVIELKGASPKSDIWSLGCTVIELLTGRPPYADIRNAMSVMFRVTEDTEPPIPERVSPLLDDFLRQCFQRDPAKRPDAGTLCEHEWLKNRGLPEELRPHDSVSSLVDDVEYTRPSVWHLSNDSAESGALIPDGTPERPRTHFPSPIPARWTSRGNGGSAVQGHSFIKTTFNKPVVCQVCTLPAKRSTVLCDRCSLVAHSKCAYNAPPKCDLRSQLLSYTRSAEKGLSLLGLPRPTTIDPSTGAVLTPWSSTEWVPTPGTRPNFGQRSTLSPSTPPVQLPTASGGFTASKRSQSSLLSEPAAQPALSTNPIPTIRGRSISLPSLNPRKRKGKEVAESPYSNTHRSVGTKSESFLPGDNDPEVARLPRVTGPSVVSVGSEHGREEVGPTEASDELPSSPTTSKNGGCLVQ